MSDRELLTGQAEMSSRTVAAFREVRNFLKELGDPNPALLKLVESMIHDHRNFSLDYIEDTGVHSVAEIRRKAKA